jgi:tetratricopeptide (TPR) repeat protein
MLDSCFVRFCLAASLLTCTATGLFSAAPCQAAPPLSPTIAAKLRRLLPFPEATLDSKMEMTFGLGYSQDQGFHFFRQSSDYAGRIGAVQRQITGGIADAARYRQLGGLYRSADLPTKSKAAFQHSEALYAGVLAQRPDDSAALAGYGRALDASGQAAIAEAFLQKATQKAPNSADVWLALGLVLEDEAVPKTEAKRHWSHAIEAAYNQAIRLAPENPAGWAMRGMFRTWSQPQLQGRMVSRGGLSDYAQAASLLPRDPDAQAQVPTIDGFTFELAHQMFTSPKAAKMEPVEADHRAEMCLRRITAIAQATHGAQAAEAYTARAWVQFEFFYDPKGAQKSLRLALQQNAHQQDAINYQMHVAAVTGNYVLLAAACRRELRRRPQVYLRVLLADADYAIATQKPVYWEEARGQMEMAHAAAPHDDALRLGLAILLLKSGQAADLSRASALLREIKPSPRWSQAQQADYDLTRGISAVLAGQDGDARRSLALTLKADPHNRPAKSALALLTH